MRRCSLCFNMNQPIPNTRENALAYRPKDKYVGDMPMPAESPISRHTSVQDALNRLSETIKLTEDLSAELTGRLELILPPASPCGVSETTPNPKNPVVLSQLVERIMVYESHLMDVNTRLRYLLGNITL